MDSKSHLILNFLGSYLRLVFYFTVNLVIIIGLILIIPGTSSYTFHFTSYTKYYGIRIIISSFILLVICPIGLFIYYYLKQKYSTSINSGGIDRENTEKV